MNVPIKIEYKTKDFGSAFQKLTDRIEKEINKTVKGWLEDVKTTALSNKNWQDRTGNLRASHKVEENDLGVSLVIDTTMGGLKDTDVQYGWLLEYSPRFASKYAWINPTIELMRPDLDAKVEAIVKKLANESLVAEGYTTREGQTKIRYRHPKGAVGSVGGQFVSVP